MGIQSCLHIASPNYTINSHDWTASSLIWISCCRHNNSLVALKVARGSVAKAALEKEVKILTHLRQLADSCVPMLLGAGVLADLLYMITSFIEVIHQCGCYNSKHEVWVAERHQTAHSAFLTSPRSGSRDYLCCKKMTSTYKLGLTDWDGLEVDQ